MDNKDIKELKDIRKEIFLIGYKGGMAHLASCYSALEILYSLYLKGLLNYRKSDPKWKDRDRFILSKGHAGLGLYCVLQKAGLITEEDLHSYLKENSKIGGEPCMRDNPWIESTTGSLGHGLSFGVGIALGLQMKGSPAKVIVMLGDGECEEGSVWEAAMSAATFHLSNLKVIVDMNEIQKMDKVESIIGMPDWEEKWKAFGWEVRHVNGHDTEEIANMDLHSDKPLCILAHTVKGKGVSIMENNPAWHFKLPNKKELRFFKQELDISDEELE